MQRTGKTTWAGAILFGALLSGWGCAGARGSTQEDAPPAPAPAHPVASDATTGATSPRPWSPNTLPQEQPTASAGAPSASRSPTIEPERWLGAGDLVPASDVGARARRAPALRETAFLFIEAEPPTARIHVDGSRAGEGRAFLRLKGSRWKVLRVEADGYEPAEGAVEVREREVVKVRLSLAPLGGRLTVVTDTPGAEALLDGESVGTTPLTLPRVAGGVHRLLLRAGSWQWSGDVEVRPGETRLIEMTVQAASPTPPAEPPRRPAAPPPAAAPPEPPPPPPAATAPSPDTAPAPASSGPSGEPPAREGPTATTAQGRPDCDAVCRRFVQAVAGSDSIREPIFNRCRERCRSGDLRFSVCAWKARDMNDVSTCMNLPE